MPKQGEEVYSPDELAAMVGGPAPKTAKVQVQIATAAIKPIGMPSPTGSINAGTTPSMPPGFVPAAVPVKQPPPQTTRVITSAPVTDIPVVAAPVTPKQKVKIEIGTSVILDVECVSASWDPGSSWLVLEFNGEPPITFNDLGALPDVWVKAGQQIFVLNGNVAPNKVRHPSTTFLLLPIRDAQDEEVLTDVFNHQPEPQENLGFLNDRNLGQSVQPAAGGGSSLDALIARYTPEA